MNWRELIAKPAATAALGLSLHRNASNWRMRLEIAPLRLEIAPDKHVDTIAHNGKVPGRLSAGPKASRSLSTCSSAPASRRLSPLEEGSPMITPRRTPALQPHAAAFGTWLVSYALRLLAMIKERALNRAIRVFLHRAQKRIGRLRSGNLSHPARCLHGYGYGRLDG